MKLRYSHELYKCVKYLLVSHARLTDKMTFQSLNRVKQYIDFMRQEF